MNQPELLELDGRPLAEPPRDLGIPSIAWLIGLIALADALVRMGPPLSFGLSLDPLPVAAS